MVVDVDDVDDEDDASLLRLKEESLPSTITLLGATSVSSFKC